MKFRFRRSSSPRRLKSPEAKRKILKLKGIDTLRKAKCRSLVLVTPTEPRGRSNRKKINSIWSAITSHLRRARAGIRSAIEKRAAMPRRLPLSTLSGILISILAVSALSGVLASFLLFFSYGGSHTDVTIPNLVSLNADYATSFSTDIFEYEVIYEENPDFECNSVISQKPLSGVTRKLYKKDGKLKITLTVNKENSRTVLPQLVGRPLRDVLGELGSSDVKIQIIKEYSDTVSSGIIFFSSLPKGAVMREGDILTLKVSLGKQIDQVSVPDLIGKSEQEAISLLERSGLKVGEVKYERSIKKTGTVISQSAASGSSLYEGEKISFSVSAGMYH